MKIKEQVVGILFIVVLFVLACNGQVQSNKSSENTKIDNHGGIVGGPFENGDFMYIGMPENIKPSDTSPGWEQPGQKLLIKGKMLKIDGKTPASGVIMYYYHTDVNGYYAESDSLDRRVARHGYIRGWVKSDEEGNYAIYTVRPAAYPNSREPAHIHPSIKEPGIDKEYYIDAFVFEDDPLLTESVKNNMELRGGSGVLKLYTKDSLQIAEHHIILGLNIPNYPEK